MRVSIQSFGEDVFSRDLMRFGERAVDIAPTLPQIAAIFYRNEEEQFRSEGGHSGGWAQLAESTVAQRIRLGIGGDHPILDRTGALGGGALRRSLTERGAEGSVLRVDADSIFIGSSIRYGVFHQQGTSRMPMRKPVELTEGAKVEIVKVLQRYIVTGALA